MSNDALYGTLPEAARRLGVSVKVLRREAKAGAFPVYTAGTARGGRARVRFAEVEAWLRSTRVERPIQARVETALAAERGRREHPVH